MLNTDSIHYVDLNLLDCQVDIILDALQLYGFNLHRVWAVNYDDKLEDFRNTMLHLTYDTILYSYHKVGCSHKEYDIKSNCKKYSDFKRRQKYLKKVA